MPQISDPDKKPMEPKGVPLNQLDFVRIMNLRLFTRSHTAAAMHST